MRGALLQEGQLRIQKSEQFFGWETALLSMDSMVFGGKAVCLQRALNFLLALPVRLMGPQINLVWQ